MTQLQSELHRQYLPRSPAPVETGAQPSAPIDHQGMVRAMVMHLTLPPSWELLAEVGHGVQTELELPAPAIAVSGIDDLQLWFSFSEPISAPQAHAFLEALRVRFSPNLKPERIRLMPASNASALHPGRDHRLDCGLGRRDLCCDRR
jgi:hypothetical protein